MDQCGFTAEETKIILDYQKKLPILVENDGIEGFCINVRDLYKQIIGSNDMSNFSRWIKRAIQNYKFAETLDFTSISPIGRGVDFTKGGDIKSHDYYCTIDMAKQLAMIDKKEAGFLTRRYFILMEKAVKKQCDWRFIREPLREGYKKMQAALDTYMMRRVQRHAEDWDYRFEADALNIIATGFPAKEIRLFVGCKDKLTRDSLTATYNEYLLKLQELNIVYLGMDMNRYDRYKMLKQSFDILYPNAIQIKDDIDITRIQSNKKQLLDEVEEKMKVYK